MMIQQYNLVSIVCGFTISVVHDVFLSFVD